MQRVGHIDRTRRIYRRSVLDIYILHAPHIFRTNQLLKSFPKSLLILQERCTDFDIPLLISRILIFVAVFPTALALGQKYRILRR